MFEGKKNQMFFFYDFFNEPLDKYYITVLLLKL